MFEKEREKEIIITDEKGDENMEMTKSNFQELDVNFIFAHGTAISSQDILSEISPITWNNDVLKGKYIGKDIITTKDKVGE